MALVIGITETYVPYLKFSLIQYLSFQKYFADFGSVYTDYNLLNSTTDQDEDLATNNSGNLNKIQKPSLIIHEFETK